MMNNFFNILFGPTNIPQPGNINVVYYEPQQLPSGEFAIGVGVVNGNVPSATVPEVTPVPSTPLPSINQVVQTNIPAIAEVPINISETITQAQDTSAAPHHGSSAGQEVDIVMPTGVSVNHTSQERTVVPATIPTEAKQYLQITQGQLDAEYESARQFVINECDAILSGPITPTEFEKYQALKQLAEDNPNMTQYVNNITKGTFDVAGWTQDAIETLLDPQTYTKTDHAAFSAASFDYVRAIGADQVTLYEMRHAAEAKTAAFKQALDSYDPASADSESAKETIKKMGDANKEFKKNLTQTWAKQQAKISATAPKIEDYSMTLSQQFQKTVGVSADYISDANSYGHGKALVNGIKNMSKIQIAGVALHTTSLALDAYEHWDDLEYALITKDGTMVEKLKALKNNVSKDTWNTLVEDTIDTTLLAADVAAGAVLTPLGGAVVGVFVLQPAGALLKTLYYKKEYGDDVDFGRTFWENMKLGNHDHFVLKQTTDDLYAEDYSDKSTLTLYGSIEKTDWYNSVQDYDTLQGYAQKIVLEGHINDTTLLGEVESTLLQGQVQYTDIGTVNPVKPTEGLVVYGEDVYNPVRGSPSIMIPDTDTAQCKAANGCVSEDEEAPDLGLLIPKPKLANDVEVFNPEDWGGEVDIAEPVGIVGPQRWPPVNSFKVIDEFVNTGYPSSELSEISMGQEVIPADLSLSLDELPIREFASEVDIAEPPSIIYAPDIGIVGPSRNR